MNELQTPSITYRKAAPGRAGLHWLAAAVVCLLAIGLLASSQGSPRLSSQHYAIPWSAFNYGCGKMASSSYSMVSAIGAEVGLEAGSQNYSLSPGFIPGWQVMMKNGYKVWLAVIKR